MFLGAIKWVIIAYLLGILLNVYVRHSFLAHKRAFHKFFWIWVISSSPIIVAILISKPTESNEGFWPQLFSRIYESITLEEQFVYAAAFIAPLLYVFIEALKIVSDTEAESFIAEIRDHLRGYLQLLLPAILVVAITALSFASAKQDPDDYGSQFLFQLFSKQPLIIYVFSLLLWYASILLDSVNAQGYFDRKNEDENSLVEGLRAIYNRNKGD